MRREGVRDQRNLPPAHSRNPFPTWWVVFARTLTCENPKERDPSGGPSLSSERAHERILRRGTMHIF